MFLANLLPGVRELRAPLAAGYMVLLGVFLAFGGHFTDEMHATGVLHTFFQVSDAFGTAGALAVLTFGAYVVGALIADGAGELFNRFGSPTGPLAKQLLTAHAQSAYAEAVAARRTSSGGDPEDATDEALRLVGEAVREDRLSLWQWLTSWAVRPDDLYTMEEIRAVDGPERQVLRLANQTNEELDLVLTRLLGAQPALYSAVDRLRSEVELRQAVATSGFVLGLGLLINGQWLAGVATMIVAAFLPFQAGRRQRDANNLLAQALWLRRVDSPTLERFRANAGLEPVGLTEPRD